MNYVECSEKAWETAFGEISNDDNEEEEVEEDVVDQDEVNKWGAILNNANNNN